jgi:hypothetical protein
MPRHPRVHAEGVLYHVMARGNNGQKIFLSQSDYEAFLEALLLTCPKCQGEMRIISFIDQPEVIKKILQHLGLWEEPHAPPDKTKKEITFDPSYSQLI